MPVALFGVLPIFYRTEEVFREIQGMTSKEMLDTLKGILYKTCRQRHFTNTGWLKRLFPNKKKPHPFSRVKSLRLFVLSL
jgi:hypothetical protein